MHKKPDILITTGDPRGIGPEITKKALKDPRIRGLADFFIIASKDKTGFDAVKKASRVLKKGGADGLVTAPVNKAAINASGIPFKGHTEYLTRIAHASRSAMMLCADRLRVTIVTRHVALKKVSRILTREKIIDAVILTDIALRRHFGFAKPRIGVCGLNPHCGEGGLLGDEEKETIAPAIKYARSKVSGVIQGVLPADIIFYKAYNGKLDAVVSMYHDQGLGPFKMVAFKTGVNVTLGLPFVRTSPNHGTAYDIAGKNIADPGSMKEAIKLAVSMSIRRSSNTSLYVKIKRSKRHTYRV